MRSSFALLLLLAPSSALAQQPQQITHVVAAIESNRFHGWPANNGAWQWGDELLVGFTQGDFSSQDGHNISGIQESHFTRSRDGGLTWQPFDPTNFMDDGNIKWQPVNKRHLTTPLNFEHPGFCLRAFGGSYHGVNDPDAGFYYSYDRGANWRGPWFLGDLNQTPPTAGMELSPRTDYIVTGPQECSLFITVNPPGESKSRRIACIKTADGGRSFEFVSWVTPPTRESRSTMPHTILLANGRWLLTSRRINVDTSVLKGAIDAYESQDQGQNWTFLSTIVEIKNNSNPSAVIQLNDGRLCCIYGDRDAAIMAGKYSSDGGRTWSDEFTIRDGYKSTDDWADMGYPRLLKRRDGQLVALYYWASAKHPLHYIEAAIWQP